jgi:hypothetical protein
MRLESVQRGSSPLAIAWEDVVIMRGLSDGRRGLVAASGSRKTPPRIEDHRDGVTGDAAFPLQPVS